MANYNVLTPSEAEIEDLIVADSSVLEEGLVVVKRQLPTTDGGQIDLLMRDAAHRAVVAELKAVEEDAAVLQGLTYLAWVHENLPALAREYPGVELAVDAVPRLLLVAPSFSLTTRKVVRYIEAPVSLFRVKVIEHKGERLLVTDPDEMDAPPPPVASAVTGDDFRDYIADDSVRSLFDEARNTIRGLAPDMVENPRQQYLALRRQGANVAIFWTRRKFFYLGHMTADGWQPPGKEVRTADDLKPLLESVREFVTAKPRQ